MSYALRRYYTEQAAIRKPEPIDETTDRKRRADEAQQRKVKKETQARDGFCRLYDHQATFGACVGISEWAHLGNTKRARTRGQAPEVRHTTAGTCQMCSRHHRDYDAGRLSIEPKTKAGADGLMTVSNGKDKADV